MPLEMLTGINRVSILKIIISFRGSYNFLQVTPPKTYENGTYLQAIQQDLMTSVFISRIPKQLDDNDMLELLNVSLGIWSMQWLYHTRECNGCTILENAMVVFTLEKELQY